MSPHTAVGLFVIATVTGMCLGRAEADTVFHVSPRGKDTWSGRLAAPDAGGSDGPVASLSGARDAVRCWRAAGGRGKALILVQKGTYAITSPLELTAEDSNLEVRAATPGSVIVEGGVRLGAWRVLGKKNGRAVWAAPVPVVNGRPLEPEQLWVNGRRAERARLPNRGWAYATGPYRYGQDPDTGTPANLSHRAFRVQPEHAKLLEKLSESALRRVVVVAYHSWETSRHWIRAFDPAHGALIVAGPGAAWPFFYWGAHLRYHLENLEAALDAPGEWWLDPRGMVRYIPLPGEDIRKTTAFVPVAEAFVRITGTAETPVRDVSFRGLTFRHSRYDLPAQGHSAGQAEYDIPAVIQADFAERIAVEDCEIAHIGTYGVWFRRGCRECAVRRSFLHDLGAGGVRLGEGEIRPEGPERTSRNIVDNNIIHGGGRIHHGAIGVWIGQSPDNAVTHNDISDLYYTGVSVGWTWGYGPALAQRNRISYNHIHYIGQGVLSDMGGVYTLGNHEGTVVSHNHIHHVWSFDLYGRGGWGLYNDEGTTRIVMENNLVHDVKTGTYHQHYGRDNVIRNNILAFSADGQIQRSRPEEHISFHLLRNIIIWDEGEPLAAHWEDGGFVAEQNIYWKLGREFRFAGRTLEEWQALGREKGTLICDPGFVNAAKRDFRFRTQEAARRIGFVPFDASRAGVYGPARWRSKAQAFPMPSRITVPVPPVGDIRMDFDSDPPGAPPLLCQVHVEGRGDSIAVSDARALSGRHSLRIQDAEGLQFEFNPHLVLTPDYREGTVRCGFAVWLGEGAVLEHEWRDWSRNPYVVGPSLRLADGVLTVFGKELCRAPQGEWIRIRVETAVGRRSGVPGWDLFVTYADGATQTFRQLPYGSGDWQRLTWVGFISRATQACDLFLDDLEITRR